MMFYQEKIPSPGPRPDVPLSRLTLEEAVKGSLAPGLAACTTTDKDEEPFGG
jgi:hypothetical protein